MIGLFDSGIGGFSIYLEIKKLIPDISYIYFADQEHFPYGEKSEDELKKFSECISSFLIEKGAKVIVVACNSATVSAINHLRSVFSIPFVGVVPAVKPAASLTKTNKIGVLLTNASSKGKVYKELIEVWGKHLTVFSLRLPELVKMIESGLIDENPTKAFLFNELRKLKDEGVDTIVLGCTHFIFLRDIIKQEFGDSFNILDPALGVARQTYRVYSTIDKNRDAKQKEDIFYTSKDPTNLKKLIKNLLNIDTDNVFSINLKCMKK